MTVQNHSNKTVAVSYHTDFRISEFRREIDSRKRRDMQILYSYSRRCGWKTNKLLGFFKGVPRRGKDLDPVLLVFRALPPPGPSPVLSVVVTRL